MPTLYNSTYAEWLYIRKMLTYEEVPQKSFFCDNTEWFPECKWTVSCMDSPIPALVQCTSAVTKNINF